MSDPVEKLAAQVKLLWRTINDLLLSADASWEEGRLGHDWAEACATARSVLRQTASRKDVAP